MLQKLFICMLLLVCAPRHNAASTPSALPSGRLVMLLHESKHIHNETPTDATVGPTTMRSALALTQQPGIVILSASIWYNLIYRKQWFNEQVSREGSLAALFYNAWTTHQKEPSAHTYARVHTLLKADPTLLHHFYVWKTDFSRWLCWKHEDTGLVILVPRAYLATRQELVPRGIPASVTPDDVATGLHLSACTPISLAETEPHLSSLTRSAKHSLKRASFSLDGLRSLFIEKKELHPLFCVHWNIYLSGHGSFELQDDQWGHLSPTLPPHVATHSKNSICGLPLTDFAQLLSTFSTALVTTCLYYQSCYGGGKNLSDAYHAARAEHAPLSSEPGLTFPLICGGLGDAPVTILMPRKHKRHQSWDITLSVDIDLPQFFTLLETPGTSWEAILKPITQTIPSDTDTHGLSDTPQILLPGSSSPAPIDVSEQPTTNAATGKYLVHAGIRPWTAYDEERSAQSKKPLILSGKRALLLMTPEIKTPIEIHPYQKIHRGKETRTSFSAPAIVSLLPGNALHHCKQIILHDSGFKDFLAQSFLDFNNQKSTKVFLIDSLTLTNDLDTHFNPLTSSLWDSLKNWFESKRTPLDDPRITLQNVLIIVGAEKITCFFLVPQQDESTIAQKTVLFRPHKQVPLPDRLSREVVSLQTHEKLFAKYMKLCQKQKAAA